MLNVWGQYGKIIHPASGAHIGPVHTVPTSTVAYVYANAPVSMKCYQTDMDDLVESELTYCTEPLDYFSTWSEATMLWSLSWKFLFSEEQKPKKFREVTEW